MGAVKPPNEKGEFTIDVRSMPPIRTLAFKDRLGFGGIARFVVALTRSRASVSAPRR